MADVRMTRFWEASTKTTYNAFSFEYIRFFTKEAVNMLHQMSLNSDKTVYLPDTDTRLFHQASQGESGIDSAQPKSKAETQLRNLVGSFQHLSLEDLRTKRYHKCQADTTLLDSIE